MYTIFIVISLGNRQLKRHEYGWITEFSGNLTESSGAYVFGRKCGMLR